MNSIIVKNKFLSLNQYLREIGQLPDEAVLFGVCEDNLPYLLNVNDDTAPHTAIENGRPVLNTIRGYVYGRDQSYVTIDIVDTSKGSTNLFLSALVEWTRVRGKKNKVILLVRDLETVEISRDFLWLLENGTKHGVYIVASFQKDVEVLEKFRLVIRQDGDGFVAPEGLDHTVRFFAL